MDLGKFRCRHCRASRRRRSLDQKYCGEPGCQKARKNAWRRSKYAADPDYRANQGDSDRAWLEAQGGAAEYHRQYRRRRRNSRRRKQVSADPVATAKSANSDAAPPKSQVDSTVYVLVPAAPGYHANSDVVLAKLLVMPSICTGSANIDSVVASASAD